MSLIGLFAVIGLMSTPNTKPVSIQLGQDGDIPAWLVAGPFPNFGALERRGTGFATDYLNGEPSARPVEGGEVPPTVDGRAKPWSLAMSPAPNGVDLRARFADYHPGIAYAYASLVSTREQTVTLLWGSDDGAKVWLNGQQLYSKQVVRGVKRDEESLVLNLKAGQNALLFKVEQGDGGWGLTARVVGPDGKSVRGISVGLELTSGKDLIHRAAGLSGSLDVESIHRYEQTKSIASFWVKRFRSDAVHPDALAKTIKQSAAKVDASANQSASALSEASRAAALKIQLAYDKARSKFLASAQNPEPLFVADVAKEDFIKPFPGGRFFAHSDGKPYIPLGFNHNPDWSKLVEANPMRDDYAPEVTDQWFATLAQNGTNLVRLMVETPPSGNMEDPVGTFLPEHMRWLDHVVTSARKHGIRLMVTPYDTFWMNNRWETTTYAADRGGPIGPKIDWYTKPEAIAAQKKRNHWLIDRYGNLETIFCWELMNEADIWWGATPAQLQKWADEVVADARAYQLKKWGREHLISISTAASTPKGALGAFAFQRKDLDMANTHLYIGLSKAPTKADQVVAPEVEGVQHALGLIRDCRPFIDSENGPIDKWVADEALDDEVHHNQSWAHLCAGGAGSGLRWPYRHPHHVTVGMLTNLKHMAEFVDKVDWTLLAGEAKTVGLQLPKELIGASYGTEKAALVFVTRPDGASLEALEFVLDGRSPKTVRAFDTHAGTWIPGKTLVLPEGVRSAAFFIQF